MKKPMVVIALAVLSAAVYAEGPTPIHGVNEDGETISADREADSLGRDGRN